jgi:hypothetical protein
MPAPTPHPLNVPGDFYVEDGCCISCLVPFEAAPEILKYDEAAAHCFVARQPSSTEERRQMVVAITLSEVRCIRYRGQDPAVLGQLIQQGEQNQCDSPLEQPAPAKATSRPTWWLRWRK